MNIAICDDLKTERERLLPMLRDYMAARGLAAGFTEFDSGEALLDAFAPGVFDLILLDVYMDGMTGVEAAKRLKAVDAGCVIIFTTTSREHGAEAFDLEALHYLVKPIQKDKLYTVLNKWYSLLCEVKTITLKCGRTAREVYIRDILYIDVLGRSSTVHTAAEHIETSMPLAALETMLPAGEFAHPIRYCLAALGHIRSVGQDSLTLDDGEEIPLSRRERENIKKQLAAYRLRALRGR